MNQLWLEVPVCWRQSVSLLRPSIKCELTRKLCCRKDDRAMRSIHECISMSSQSRTMESSSTQQCLLCKIFSLAIRQNLSMFPRATKSEGVGLIVCTISFQDF